MIQSRNLKKYKNLSHYFFSKKGGVSKGIYESLNCGVGSRDRKNNIKKNLNIVKKKIGCHKNKLILLKQIHSNKIYKINNLPKKRLVGDGLITNKRGVALGILTADCAPVFIYDKKLNKIAAFHAGWKGAYKEITENTIKALIKDGSKIKDMISVIGPCISQKNYEVKKEFFKKFIRKNKINRCFFLVKNNMFYFDLAKYIKFQIKKFGINIIEILKKDTFVRNNNLFSARYSLKKKYNDYGRNISIIMIK